MLIKSAGIKCINVGVQKKYPSTFWISNVHRFLYHGNVHELHKVCIYLDAKNKIIIAIQVRILTVGCVCQLSLNPSRLLFILWHIGGRKYNVCSTENKISGVEQVVYFRRPKLFPQGPKPAINKTCENHNSL